MKGIKRCQKRLMENRKIAVTLHKRAEGTWGSVRWCVVEADPPKPFALQSQPPDVRQERGRSTKYEKRFHMPQTLSSIIMSVWILFIVLNPKRMSCFSLWWYKCATMCYRSFLTQPVLCATGVQELRPRLVLRPGDEVWLPAAVRRVRSRGQGLPRRPSSPAGRHLPGKKKRTTRRTPRYWCDELHARL